MTLIIKNITTNIIFIILLLSSGCAYHKIEKLKEMPDNVNNFSKALSDAYLEFALSEMNDMHDEVDAAYFANKGINAKLGQKVLPEKVNNWKIDKKYLQEVNLKRSELLKIINSDRAKKFPILTARAQLGFDCWLEQLEENWQTEDIAKCYNMMNSNMQTVSNETSSSNKKITKIENIKQKSKVTDLEITQIKDVKEIKKVENTNVKQKFELYFDHDVFKLNLKMKNMINNILTNYNTKKETIIEIIGHADRSGPEEYNLILSKLRANSVRQHLLSKGVSEFNVSTYYYGETKPKLITADGVKEKINRRVEIFINNKESQVSRL